MFHSLLLPGFRLIILIVFACCLSLSGNRVSAQTPAPPTPPHDAPAKTASTPSPPAASQNEEVSSHETPTTFKALVHVVLVGVVVRASRCNRISDLKNDEFQ